MAGRILGKLTMAPRNSEPMVLPLPQMVLSPAPGKRAAYAAVPAWRWGVRFLLSVVLVGTCGLAGWTWYSNQPEHLWKSAQASMTAGDWPTAKTLLQKLLQKEPNHGDAHLALSEAWLKEAEAAGQPATASVPQAMSELVEAARNLPDNVELQKKLLTMYMETRQFKPAAVVAPAVLKHDEQNPDALLAMAWQAVEAQDSRAAEAQLAKLENVEGRAVFETLALRAQVEIGADDKAPLQKTLEAAVREAGELTVEHWRRHPQRTRPAIAAAAASRRDGPVSRSRAASPGSGPAGGHRLNASGRQQP